MEEMVAPAEELEEAAITTVTDTSFLDANRKKMKAAQIDHPNEQHDQRESDGRQRRTTRRS